MKVYVVEAGYDYEGGSVRGVFDTEEKANKYIASVDTKKPGRLDWIELIEMELNNGQEI